MQWKRQVKHLNATTLPKFKYLINPPNKLNFMFTIINDFIKRDGRAKGFQMTFENGNTISVMFGEGNYCPESSFANGKTTNNLAEIAIWNKSGEWYDFESDQVKGYCSPDEVAKFIDFASKTTF